MKKEDVIAQLGAPDSVRVRGKIEYLTYYLTANPKEGKQPYMVRLVDRRVDTVGRFVQLPNLTGSRASNLSMGAILSSEILPAEPLRPQ